MRSQDIDFKTLNSTILPQIEPLLARLFPAGVKVGREFAIGNVCGDAGQSLRVCLSGAKAGVWCDFATGEKGGDIISLWAAHRSSSQVEAARELVNMLGAT